MITTFPIDRTGPVLEMRRCASIARESPISQSVGALTHQLTRKTTPPRQVHGPPHALSPLKAHRPKAKESLSICSFLRNLRGRRSTPHAPGRFRAPPAVPHRHSQGHKTRCTVHVVFDASTASKTTRGTRRVHPTRHAQGTKQGTSKCPAKCPVEFPTTAQKGAPNLWA